PTPTVVRPDPPTAAPDGTYVVQPGDGWWAIARAHGIAAVDLAKMNGATTGTLIHPGQTLRTPKVAAGTVHRVVAGDTMSRIARTAKVSLDALLAANPKVHPDRIEIGQVIALPISTYTVRPGDSWWAIASRHGTTHGALAALNGKTTADTIHPGDVLRVA
ncbi:LysM peptidoglycan-binding domain-containing protein, partial [Micrococcus luteus]|nr:LysM peptidoglycan-binding domain-containing protein [Micrococcus luteus]MCV7574060.1 LysM peptidoglycan-binding domain-containing protein [Micrococcus luteus]